MKTAQFSILMLLSLGTLAFNAYAQDYTRWSLPEDAKARLGKGHLAGVIAYSPDGAMLVSGGYDKNVRLWEVETGREKGRLAGHKGGIAAVTFSPNSTLILRASLDGTVRV